MDETYSCPHCGEPHARWSQFCDTSGKPLPAARVLVEEMDRGLLEADDDRFAIPIENTGGGTLLVTHAAAHDCRWLEALPEELYIESGETAELHCVITLAALRAERANETVLRLTLSCPRPKGSPTALGLVHVKVTARCGIHRPAPVERARPIAPSAVDGTGAIPGTPKGARADLSGMTIVLDEDEAVRAQEADGGSGADDVIVIFDEDDVEGSGNAATDGRIRQDLSGMVVDGSSRDDR